MVSTSTSHNGIRDYWPDAGLENVPACPVCGNSGRKAIHANLRDRMFGCAPRKGDVQRCNDCDSGCLNPRPTLATIGLACGKHLTHHPTGGVDYATAS
jgi:hypothetical protein